MATIHHRTTHILLALVLVALLAVIGMLATGVRGGPLDPSGPPASTESVRLPGTPIAQPAAFPIVLNQPGRYYLVENITGASGQNGISIQADHVTLDLNGFTLKGVPGSLIGIAITSPQRHVTVRNGMIAAWGEEGINNESDPLVDSLIEHVSVFENGADGIRLNATDSVVRDCNSSHNGGKGVYLIGGAQNLVTRCVLNDNGGQGLHVAGASVANQIVDNVAISNGVNSTGMWIQGSRTVVSDNRAQDNLNHGFWFDGASVVAYRNVAISNDVGGYNITGACIGCGIGPISDTDSSTSPWGNVSD